MTKQTKGSDDKKSASVNRSSGGSGTARTGGSETGRSTTRSGTGKSSGRTGSGSGTGRTGSGNSTGRTGSGSGSGRTSRNGSGRSGQGTRTAGNRTRRSAAARRKKKQQAMVIKLFAAVLVLTLIAGGLVYYFLRPDKGNDEMKLSAKDINKNTLLVNDDGKIQSALIEDFDKDYYDIKELKDFAKDDIKEFNEKNGTKVKLNDGIVHDKKAVLVFDYDSIADFAAYMNMKAEILKGSEALNDDRVPDQLTVYGKDDAMPKDRVFEKEGYTVVIITADKEMDVKVNGKIAYYSGCKTEDEHTAAVEGKRAVIVFK